MMRFILYMTGALGTQEAARVVDGPIPEDFAKPNGCFPVEGLPYINAPSAEKPGHVDMFVPSWAANIFDLWRLRTISMDIAEHAIRRGVLDEDFRSAVMTVGALGSRRALLDFILSDDTVAEPEGSQ